MWLGLSTGMAFTGVQPNGLWLDLSPGAQLSPTAVGGGSYVADATGAVTVPIPIPASFPRATGFFAQWAAFDPQGSFTPLPGLTLVLSDARHVFIW